MTKMLVIGRYVLGGFGKDGTPQIYDDAGILVEGDRITQIGPASDLRQGHPDAAIIGGTGHVIIPGLVNAHHHVGLTPFQLGSPDLPLELWFASRLALREVAPRLDTLYSAFEMIASGVTTVQHLHSRAPGGAGEIMDAADAILGAYREVGMRVSYSFALRDQNRLVYEADEDFLSRVPVEHQYELADYFRRFTLPLDEQIALFGQLRGRYGGRPLTAIQIAPSNLHWLSDAALESAGRMAEETGAPMHMHLLETPYQKEYAYRRTGVPAMQYIERMGLAGPDLTIGHGVWMDQADIEICAHTGTRVCLNCSSNFRLKSGQAPLGAFVREGIPVALGIDEAGINDDRDMLQEMRLVLSTHRKPGIDSWAPGAAQVLRMATEHGAATTPFANDIGRIEVGRAADLVVLDWRCMTRPYQDPAAALVDVIVRRARQEAVETVIIGGEVVYSGGRFTRLDHHAVLEEIAARLASPPSAQEVRMRALAQGIMPAVRSFYKGYADTILAGRDQ